MKNKFTFHELLLISGVSIAAAALLIPTLNGATKKSVQLGCLDKQKVLYQAFTSYTNDHSGLLPDGAVLNRRSQAGWWNVLYCYTQKNTLIHKKNGKFITDFTPESNIGRAQVDGEFVFADTSSHSRDQIDLYLL